MIAAPWSGTKQLGVAAATTYGYGTAVDAGGNVYVVGSTNGGLDGNTRTGITDFFITKYDASGKKLSTTQLGVAGFNTQARSVAVDAKNGYVYVAGATTGGLDGNTLTGVQDFFLTQYNLAGTKQYTRQLGVAGANTYSYGTAVDAGGNVYVAGFTNGGLDGNTLTGTQDFFVTKYNSAGTKLYTKQLGVAGARTFSSGTATDAGGNVYVAGATTGGLDGNTLAGMYDFFVTKYNSAGTKQYTRQLGVAGATNTFGSGTAVDAGGNVYVVGNTNGGLDGNTLTGTQDFFVTKYNSAGTKQ